MKGTKRRKQAEIIPIDKFGNANFGKIFSHSIFFIRFSLGVSLYKNDILL